MEEVTNSKKPKLVEPTWAGKVLVILLIVASLLLIVTLARALLPKERLVKKDQYQAIFLTNGQVYFGKLSGVNSEYVVLKSIYYLQEDNQNLQNQTQTEAAQPNLKLIKLGSELHGPEDEMFVERDKIIFWENLKNDGRIAEEINKQ